VKEKNSATCQAAGCVKNAQATAAGLLF